MKYTPSTESIPQSSRRAVNEKLLYLIDNNCCEAYGITKQDVFQGYTGDGGLHGLSRKNYRSYHTYSEAKKELENGQFFTPPALCQFVADCLRLEEDDLVADLTCGMGNFFNVMPVEANVYGCELDTKAFKVASYLYPEANLVNKDIRNYMPQVRFDYVVGNPPFNLQWMAENGKEYLSQLYYCLKAAQFLKPLGILALIVPNSFLADSFSDSSMIRKMEAQFRFLGQILLPDDTFAQMGVSQFPIKLQFWQKKGVDSETPARYHTGMDNDLSGGIYAGAAQAIHMSLLQMPKAMLKENRAKILRELAKERQTSASFTYTVEKMLYQIRIHPSLKDRYAQCCAYLHRFYTETQPPEMRYEEWCKRRLTEAKVLHYLRQTLRRQNRQPERDEIHLVKRDYSFAYKGYSAAVRRRMSEELRQPIPVCEAVLRGETLPGYERLLRKKRHEYLIQSQPFQEMTPDTGIGKWLDDFWLWDAENEEEILLNDTQLHDLNLALQKRYTLLQWEQGSGKTLAGIAYGKYRMDRQGYRNSWVISSAISIRNNWNVVLPNYDVSYVFVERLRDLERIKPGDFVLMTFNALCKYRRQIKKWLKIHSRKTCLVLDESDEICNPYSSRAKAVLSCFRRCQSKLLTTGTSTRNNISEFAPQMELLYNNSINMLSCCHTIYHYDKDGTATRETNPWYGQPIPTYRRGYTLFANSHLPEKITVFGVGQRTQDIYNADILRDILAKTVITRTFEEVTGKDIKRIHQEPIPFSAEEKAVWVQAVKEFHTMRQKHFTSTNNARKDAMLRIIQQITLLLRISAAPNTVSEYSGELPGKLRRTIQLTGSWAEEIVAIGVRHTVVLDAYAAALREAFPNRPLFIVTGATTTFAKRRALRQTLRESGNGILLCTQQSLPSSVNFEFVNKVIIPELHYNNSRMSQFYMRFIRFKSVDWKDIYFLTYAQSIESNLMQMILAKEKLNLFMKGDEADMDDIYERFGVDYDLTSLLLYRDIDEDGRFSIRWGEQEIA